MLTQKNEREAFDTVKSALTMLAAYPNQLAQANTLLQESIYPHDPNAKLHCKTRAGKDFTYTYVLPLVYQGKSARELIARMVTASRGRLVEVKNQAKLAKARVAGVTTQYQVTTDAIARAIAEAHKGALSPKSRDAVVKDLRRLAELLKSTQEWATLEKIFAVQTAACRQLAEDLTQISHYLHRQYEAEAQRIDTLLKDVDDNSEYSLTHWKRDLQNMVQQAESVQSTAVKKAIDCTKEATDSAARLVGALEIIATYYQTAAGEIEKSQIEKAGTLIQSLLFDSSYKIWKDLVQFIDKQFPPGPIG